MEISQVECAQNQHDAESGQPEDIQRKSVQKTHDAENGHPEDIQRKSAPKQPKAKNEQPNSFSSFSKILPVNAGPY